MPKFIDASVLVHAYIKPKRELKPHEARIKEEAKGIVQSINDGEQVLTTVVHFGEVSNLLEDYMPIRDALALEKGIVFKENIEMVSISKENYLSALSIAEEYGVGVNDALAYVAMKERGVDQIYSFDKDFDLFGDIARVER